MSRVEVTQEEYYAKVPKVVVYHPKLTGNDVRVYATLSERAGTKRKAWPGIRRMATDLAVSPTTVQRALDKLEDLKLIVVDRRDGMVNNYHLPIVTVPESVTPPYQNLTRTVPESGTELDQRTRTSPNGDTNQLFEAFFQAWHDRPYNPDQKLSKTERGRLNKAVKEARSMGVSADDVLARARQYRKTWSEMEVTPQALLANWTRMEPDKPIPDCGRCGNRGVVWVDPDGLPTTPDDPTADTAVPCSECRGAA